MIWYILILLLLTLILWMLFVPLALCLDSDQGRYLVRLPGIIKVAVVPSDGLFHIGGRVLFVPYRIDPFKRRRRKRKSVTSRRIKADPKKYGIPKRFARMRVAGKIARSFRIRRFYLNIDTDDFILNAKLIPLFSAFNSDRIRMQANFQGAASIHLDVRIRIGTVLWILFLNRITANK